MLPYHSQFESTLAMSEVPGFVFRQHAQHPSQFFQQTRPYVGPAQAWSRQPAVRSAGYPLQNQQQYFMRQNNSRRDLWLSPERPTQYWQQPSSVPPYRLLYAPIQPLMTNQMSRDFHAHSSWYPTHHSEYHAVPNHFQALYSNMNTNGQLNSEAAKKHRRSKRRGRAGCNATNSMRNNCPSVSAQLSSHPNSLVTSPSSRTRTKFLPPTDSEQPYDPEGLLEDRIADLSTDIDCANSKMPSSPSKDNPPSAPASHEVWTDAKSLQVDLRLSLIGLAKPSTSATQISSADAGVDADADADANCAEPSLDLRDRAELLKNLHAEIDNMSSPEEAAICLKWIHETFYKVGDRIQRLKKLTWLDLHSSVHEDLFEAVRASSSDNLLCDEETLMSGGGQ